MSKNIKNPHLEPMQYDPPRFFNAEPKSPPRVDPNIFKQVAKPILVYYVNASAMNSNDVDQVVTAFEQRMRPKLLEIGWHTFIVPIYDGRDSYIESHSVSRLDEKTFEEFKTQIQKEIDDIK